MPAAERPFSAAVTVAGRLLKRVQVQGARQADAEAYELYAAGRRAKGNAADGPFSAAVTENIEPGGDFVRARRPRLLHRRLIDEDP